jgi:hypothetical protein
MEGLVLLMLYIIIAVSFWYYPVSAAEAVDGVMTSRGDSTVS